MKLHTSDSDGNRLPMFFVDANGCWIWTRATGWKGYGRAQDGDHTVAAHRWIWEAFNGPIPKGMELDHLCRVHLCVNPAHLEVVDHRTNTLRGVGVTARMVRQTECKNGHPLSGDNVRMHGRYRICRACRKQYWLTYKRRLAQAGEGKR